MKGGWKTKKKSSLFPSCKLSNSVTALGGLWWRSGFPWAPRRLAWQAWHLVTSTFVLRVTRGTGWHPPSLCVAGVALTALGGLWWRSGFPWAPRRLAWQAWRLATSTFVLRGRRGAGWHPPSLCVAGVALGDIDRHFMWQGSHLSHTQLVHTQRVLTQLAHTQLVHTQLVHTQLVHTQLAHTQRVLTQLVHTQLVHTQLVHCTTCCRGRRGTWRHLSSLCVAGVALGAIHLRFAWQAWHLRHWAGSWWTLEHDYIRPRQDMPHETAVLACRVRKSLVGRLPPFSARASLYILSRTWRKYPMRPELGRSLTPPRRLGGWGDPLGTISKWGRVIATRGLRGAHWDDVCWVNRIIAMAIGTTLDRQGLSNLRPFDTWAIARLHEVHRHRVYLTVS